MQIHQIKPKNKRKNKKRVGRGGKKGTYSGRGMKGQKSRAGRKMVPIIREFIKRYPKLKGYRAKNVINEKIAVLNLDVLAKNFKDLDNIDPKILLEKGLIRRINGRVPKVKILAKGEIKNKLNIKDCGFSKIAKEKIESAGGSIK